MCFYNNLLILIYSCRKFELSQALDIKSMKLYPEAGRIYRDLENLGVLQNDKITVELLSSFDQLHYHGVEAVKKCIDVLGINELDYILEVGAGWGGPSRYIADRTNSQIVALELQRDFHEVGLDLTKRCGLSEKVEHICFDFLKYEQEKTRFDKIVSWLALYHIPDRKNICKKLFKLLRPGGKLFIEDLVMLDNTSKVDWNSLQKDLFANSLILTSEYRHQLQAVGFNIEYSEDMTSKWVSFTNNRYQDFLKGERKFIKLHGQHLFDQISYFYRKIVEYFDARAIGGLQVICSKPE